MSMFRCPINNIYLVRNKPLEYSNFIKFLTSLPPAAFGDMKVNIIDALNCSEFNKRIAR